jgi:flagellar hook-associated protein 2
MASLSHNQQTSLDEIGLMVSEDGSISIDKDILSQAVTPERAESTFDTLSRFRDSIGEKAQNISVNPMNYVNKVVVAYKNPGHNFATPYISSIYSGMILDSYV